MTPLITRLREAESGSRELSDQVLLGLGWTCTKTYFFSKVDGRQHPTNEWRSPAGKVYFNDQRPNPTVLLDDAVALVPEGSEWDVGHIKGNGCYSAHVMRSNGDGMVIYSAQAGGAKPRTPPLALCIALLIAREEVE